MILKNTLKCSFKLSINFYILSRSTPSNLVFISELLTNQAVRVFGLLADSMPEHVQVFPSELDGEV